MGETSVETVTALCFCVHSRRRPACSLQVFAYHTVTQLLSLASSVKRAQSKKIILAMISLGASVGLHVSVFRADRYWDGECLAEVSS